MERGDQVIAVQDISTGFFGSVRKGTTGVIVAVKGFFTTRYDVAFEDGQTVEDVNESAIRRI
ncbi:hypothetical protein [Gulosibacter hominis]|nr:hypothetical protein [Gulosibacter hominis]